MYNVIILASFSKSGQRQQPKKTIEIVLKVPKYTYKVNHVKKSWEQLSKCLKKTLFVHNIRKNIYNKIRNLVNKRREKATNDFI